MTSSAERIYGLDVFRATAILLVLFSHSKILRVNAFDFLPNIPVIDGVELFFVLSGFLIGGILIRQIENEQKFNLKDLLVFWKRRWFRTIPTYYLILTLNIFFTKMGIISGDLNQFDYSFFIFCQNLSHGFYDFFWESWSLSVEEWFYISLPILFFFISYIFSFKNTTLISIGLLIIIPFLYRLSISNQKVDQFWWDVEFRKVVLTRIDAISYGVLAAYIKFHYKYFWFKYRKWLFFFGLIILYIILYINKDFNSFFFKTFYFNFISFGAVLLLPLADSIHKYKNKKIGSFFTFISKISYSLYLINLSIVISVITTNFELETNTNQIIAYFSYWVIVIVLSWIVYTFYEKPIMNLRDK